MTATLLPSSCSPSLQRAVWTVSPAGTSTSLLTKDIFTLKLLPPLKLWDVRGVEHPGGVDEDSGEEDLHRGGSEWTEH